MVDSGLYVGFEACVNSIAVAEFSDRENMSVRSVRSHATPRFTIARLLPGLRLRVNATLSNELVRVSVHVCLSIWSVFSSVRRYIVQTARSRNAHALCLVPASPQRDSMHPVT